MLLKPFIPPCPMKLYVQSGSVFAKQKCIEGLVRIKKINETREKMLGCIILLLLFSLFLFIPLISATQKTIYITPGEFGQLFAINNPVVSRDDCLMPLYRLRENVRRHGYEIKQATTLKNLPDVHSIVVFDQLPDGWLADLLAYPKEQRILFLWEPPTVKPENYNQLYHSFFSKVFTWWDDLVDNKTYFKFYYPQPSLSMIDSRVSYSEKKLTTLIAKNKASSYPQELYSQRLDVISFFEKKHPHDFDLFGHWWQGRRLRTYQGTVERKVDCLKNYKFCFCYENCAGLNGYVTEKIFDCFVAGCIPIYWGAPNIAQYVPPQCFIDRQKFASTQELYDYIQKFNAFEYNIYLEHMRIFLCSKQVQFFSTQYFIELFCWHVIGEEIGPLSIFHEREKKDHDIVPPLWQWLSPTYYDEHIKKEKPIVVVVPSYKNALWYAYNLASIFAQRYTNYRIIYIDDCSPDGTADLVNHYVQKHNQGHRFKLIRNTHRVGALENLFRAIHSCDDREIIVTLDADDWFACSNVLSIINDAYQDAQVWMTYGQFMRFPNNSIGCCAQLPQGIVHNRTYRSHGGYSHLRTFYAGLFKKIKQEDLMDNDVFYQMSWDIAMMVPMLEMADGKFKFISQVLYVYNCANVLNDFRVDYDLQVKLDRAIRTKSPYKPIETYA